MRTIQKEEGRSTLINGHSDLDKLKGQASDVYLVDVCFLENNTDCINRLTKLGFKQDPDVLDTWFSSAIWPHSTLGWPDPENAETEKSSPLGAFNNQPDCLEFYYPGSCLVTGRDIITLWVARMVLSGLYNMGDIPFSDVFIHANILDGKGERMSKSNGNGIDPVDIIEAYGTDAMRYVLCDMQTGNQDIRLPVTAVCPSCEKHNELAKTKHGKSVFTFVCSQCKTEFDVLGTMPGIPAAKLVSERFNEGSRFCNKLWNASRFALGNLINVPKSTLTTDQLELEDRWILSSLNQTIRVVTKWLKNYNPSNALGAARDFMWGDLCDWYLELVKPRLSKRGSPSAAIAQQVVAHCLDQTLRLLHPFVPFITEYLYQQLCIQVPERGLSDLSDKGVTSKMLLNSTWPKPIETLDDEHLIKTFADLQKATSGVREVRATQGVSPKKPVDVTIRPPKERSSDLKSQAHVIKHLANIDQLTVDPRAKRPKGAASLVIGDLPIFVHDMVNDEEERNRLQNRMKQVENEIGNCQKRLSNKNFVTRAPFEVVEQLQQKLIQHKNQKEAIIQALAEL